MKRIEQLGMELVTIAAIVLGAGAFVLALSLHNTFTPSEELQIFYNQQVLILYIPNTFSSLQGFAFEVTYDEKQRRVISLNEFSETASLSLSNFPSPTCISFSMSGGGLFSLSECREITNIRKSVTSRQAFWIDPTTFMPVNLRILSSDQVVGQCSPGFICTFEFSPFPQG